MLHKFKLQLLRVTKVLKSVLMSSMSHLISEIAVALLNWPAQREWNTPVYCSENLLLHNHRDQLNVQQVLNQLGSILRIHLMKSVTSKSALTITISPWLLSSQDLLIQERWPISKSSMMESQSFQLQVEWLLEPTVYHHGSSTFKESDLYESLC